MGQKSNTLTLRKHLHKDLSFLNTTKESVAFLKGFKFVHFLENLFQKKDILVIKKVTSFSNSQLFLKLTLFFRSIKLTKYRRKIEKRYSKALLGGGSFSTKKKLLNNNISHFFFNNIKINNLLLLVLDLNVSNKVIDSNLVKYLFTKLNRFITILFLRRFNLFLDLLKVISLVCQNEANANTFLFMLGQIFRILPKRKHSRFLFFCKFLFQFIVYDSLFNKSITKNKICGIKFLINGKLQGKTRATTSCIQVGAVPIQSIDKVVEFSKIHVYTLNGAFGFKIWIYKN